MLITSTGTIGSDHPNFISGQGEFTQIQVYVTVNKITRMVAQFVGLYAKMEAHKFILSLKE